LTLARADAAGEASPAGRVVKDRPMRATYEVPVEGPAGPTRVYVKVRRAHGLAARTKRRLRAPRGPAEGALLRALAARGVAVAGHGLAPGPRLALAALRAYAGGDRAQARSWMRLAVPIERVVARTYRRGRSRRAQRDGRHFETFAPAGRGSRGVRARERTP